MGFGLLIVLFGLLLCIGIITSLVEIFSGESRLTKTASSCISGMGTLLLIISIATMFLGWAYCENEETQRIYYIASEVEVTSPDKTIFKTEDGNYYSINNNYDYSKEYVLCLDNKGTDSNLKDDVIINVFVKD